MSTTIGSAETGIATLVHGEELRIGSGRTQKFEGADFGGAISYFLVDNAPGEGPDLHRHPYPETWLVLEGEARFTVGGEQFVAGAGDTATGPANVWHGFKNCGEGRLKILGIHAAPRVVQEEYADVVGEPAPEI
ncbi:cupin domain-containing protein [Agromyces seonyuensis]|uniref:Cupin domain-containing protein n=1 Tax=Agromyces seonyuensis TaxID=2662446 RepID=A0A6I4NZQ2_9MICO|nr:cupin domain-containing protein [Agromyces seonyuensis]MWB99803.1 cupin domain-containing protein [Agromyces seonyuensis]